MTVILLILGALLGIALSAVVSAVETGAYCMNRVRLRVQTEQGNPAARRLTRVLEHPEDVVMIALLGNALADYVGTACVTALLLAAAFHAHQAELWASVIMTPVLLVFGGLIPKETFRRRPEPGMHALALPVQAGVRLLRATGILQAMRAITRRIVRRIDPGQDGDAQELLPRAKMLHMLHEGAARGGLSVFQRDLMDRVLRLSEVRIGAVMIPRARVASVPIDIARGDFLRIARMAHFSRLPVWKDDPRNIIGIVNVYDVLTDRQSRPLTSHLTAPLILPAGTNVAAALLRLQSARAAMAIVQDRRGHAVGILTVKDLVEELVGDLEAW